MKVLTIGTSLITERFISALKQVEGTELIAIYSRTKETGQAFADKVGGPTVYTDLQEALKSDSFDTVYVASPNTFHYQHAKQALLAGKHVLCEKPFTSTKAQLLELIEIASDKELMLMEAITTLFLPNFKLIQEKVMEIGDIKLINANFSQLSSRYGLYKKGQVTNIFNPEFDGGALRDINVYNIHFTTYLFGRPHQVIYYPNKGFNGVDTSGVLILDYEQFKAVLIAAKDSSSESFGLIQGDQQTIKVHGSSLGRSAKVSMLGAITDLAQEGQQLISTDQDDHMTYEIKAFRDLIKNADFELRDHYLEHSLLVLDVLEMAETNE